MPKNPHCKHPMTVSFYCKGKKLQPFSEMLIIVSLRKLGMECHYREHDYNWYKSNFVLVIFLFFRVRKSAVCPPHPVFLIVDPPSYFGLIPFPLTREFFMWDIYWMIHASKFLFPENTFLCILGFVITLSAEKMATFLGRTCRLHQQLCGARRFIQRHSLRCVSTSDKKESISFTPADISDDAKRSELHKRLEEHFKDDDLNAPKVSTQTQSSKS